MLSLCSGICRAEINNICELNNKLVTIQIYDHCYTLFLTNLYEIIVQKPCTIGGVLLSIFDIISDTDKFVLRSTRCWLQRTSQESLEIECQKFAPISFQRCFNWYYQEIQSISIEDASDLRDFRGLEQLSSLRSLRVNNMVSSPRLRHLLSLKKRLQILEIINSAPIEDYWLIRHFTFLEGFGLCGLEVASYMNQLTVLSLHDEDLMNISDYDAVSRRFRVLFLRISATDTLKIKVAAQICMLPSLQQVQVDFEPATITKNRIRRQRFLNIEGIKERDRCFKHDVPFIMLSLQNYYWLDI